MAHCTYLGDNVEVIPRLGAGFDAAFFDPPYNTGRSAERNSYLNNFSQAAWEQSLRVRLDVTWRALAADAVLIVTIDERQLGTMLTLVSEVTGVQPHVVTVRVLRAGTYRKSGFRRTAEFFLFVHRGAMRPRPAPLGPEWALTDKTSSGLKATAGGIRWNPMFRSGSSTQPGTSSHSIYPLWVKHGRIVAVGDQHPDAHPVWPVDGQGRTGRWRLRPEKAQYLLDRGLLKLGATSPRGRTPVYYLPQTQVDAIDAGHIEALGLDAHGVQQLKLLGERNVLPGTVWDVPTHDYSVYGSQLLDTLVPGAHFTHPKSVYAVADALRFYPVERVLDVYAGSGTTAHAVMALNMHDEGNRESHSITIGNSEYHEVLIPRLQAAKTIPLTYKGLLEGYVGTLPGEVIDLGEQLP